MAVYLKRTRKSTDNSWEIGKIYKEAEDGTIAFGPPYTHRCDKSTWLDCVERGKLEYATEEEWNEQEEISSNPLIYN